MLTESDAFILVNVMICAEERRYLLMVFQHTHNESTSLCCSAFLLQRINTMVLIAIKHALNYALEKISSAIIT
jgi:hypothetical protein